jgi:hypothetical protein
VQTHYLLDRLSLAFENLTVAKDIAHELGRDQVLPPEIAERLRKIAEEAASIYVAIPREDRPSRVRGSVS